jgi:hypothetical protein
VIGIMSEEQATELPRAYVVPQGGLAKWQDGAARKRLEEEIMKWVAGQVSVWVCRKRGSLRLIS